MPAKHSLPILSPPMHLLMKAQGEKARLNSFSRLGWKLSCWCLLIIHRLCISDVGYGSGEDLHKPSGVLPLLHCRLVSGSLIISYCGLPNVLSDSPSSLSKILLAHGEGLPLCPSSPRLICNQALKGSAQPQASTLPVVVFLPSVLDFSLFWSLQKLSCCLNISNS